MAIATIERDPARDTGTPDLRFRLLQQVCGTPQAAFWRAIDRRSGKPCVVRVIDADREQSSRRLGELHRERTLAERIDHPGVLHADVPLIEAERIFQVVDPEPARAVERDAEGGRLAVLNLLVAVAAVLSAAHARGVYHGALSRESCLRSGDGRVLVQGFMGDAAGAAAVRDGAATDHRAFLEFATDMLRATGGPPPRLRRYFTQHLSAGAPKASPSAMAELCADLRESLEDTFPWPLAGPTAEAAAPVGPALVAAVKSIVPVIVEGPRASVPSAADESPTLSLPIALAIEETPTLTLPIALAANESTKEPAADVPARLEAVPPASKRADAGRPRPKERNAVAAPARLTVLDPAASGLELVRPSGAGRGRRAKAPAVDRQPEAPEAVPARTDVPVLQQLTANPAVATLRAAGKPVQADEPRGRGWRPWLAGLVALLAIAATLQFTPKSRPTASLASPAGVDAAGAPPVAAAPVVAPKPATSASAAVDLAPASRAEVPALPATRALPAVDAPSRVAPQAAATVRPAPAAVPAPRMPATRTAAAVAPALASPAAQDDSAGSAAAAVSGRVATLVAGGNRALNALEPGAATEAFAAALALSPDDRAAREGSQRARRLQGVAALLRDAREATARDDHGRAVQGYSQALANDPRNRGLAEALATSRRSFGRDATSALLAEGHAALGAGRLEAARAAFEKALAADPLAPGARRAAEQAATAILLRDEAEERRSTQSVAGRD